MDSMDKVFTTLNNLKSELVNMQAEYKELKEAYTNLKEAYVKLRMETSLMESSDSPKEQNFALIDEDTTKKDNITKEIIEDIQNQSIN